MSEPKTYTLGKRLFKTINGEIIFGDASYIEVPERGVEVLIKTPFTAKGGNIMPYMADILVNAPGAIQIHPMNILWSTPLDEFKTVSSAYTKATSIIDLSASSI